MSAPRTFKIDDPLMRGEDVEEWQEMLQRVLDSWGVDLRVKVDGVYGLGSRSISKMVAYGLGFTHDQFDDGITPWLRSLTRNKGLRSSEQEKRIADRAKYRADLRKKFEDEDVAAPIGRIITMTWGWTPPVHDGIDLICGPDAPLYAICDAVVIDVRASGWWGSSPTGQVWRGDGIIQIRSLTDVGPFAVGMHIGYGHAEGSRVKVGQKVEAGQHIGDAGLAVAWHTHLMANKGAKEIVRGRPVGLRGVGSFDPRPLVNYAIAND